MSIMCFRCRDPDCITVSFLCHICDENIHKCKPFHHREVFMNGMYQPLSPSSYVAIEEDKPTLRPSSE